MSHACVNRRQELRGTTSMPSWSGEAPDPPDSPALSTRQIGPRNAPTTHCKQRPSVGVTLCEDIKLTLRLTWVVVFSKVIESVGHQLRRPRLPMSVQQRAGQVRLATGPRGLAGKEEAIAPSTHSTTTTKSFVDFQLLFAVPPLRVAHTC